MKVFAPRKNILRVFAVDVSDNLDFFSDDRQIAFVFFKDGLNKVFLVTAAGCFLESKPAFRN